MSHKRRRRPQPPPLIARLLISTTASALKPTTLLNKHRSQDLQWLPARARRATPHQPCADEHPGAGCSPCLGQRECTHSSGNLWRRRHRYHRIRIRIRRRAFSFGGCVSLPHTKHVQRHDGAQPDVVLDDLRVRGTVLSVLGMDEDPSQASNTALLSDLSLMPVQRRLGVRITG
ncbi:hypothetical protein BD413DRAFT_90681 [Trametes elegans]|nr:hypothetical protein BD413DRAFT_90681 [Trametes elegans]